MSVFLNFILIGLVISSFVIGMIALTEVRNIQTEPIIVIPSVTETPDVSTSPIIPITTITEYGTFLQLANNGFTGSGPQTNRTVEPWFEDFVTSQTLSALVKQTGTSNINLFVNGISEQGIIIEETGLYYINYTVECRSNPSDPGPNTIIWQIGFGGDPNEVPQPFPQYTVGEVQFYDNSNMTTSSSILIGTDVIEVSSTPRIVVPYVRLAQAPMNNWGINFHAHRLIVYKIADN